MGKRAQYKVKMGSNATGIRTYRVMKRGKIRFRIRVKTLSETRIEKSVVAYLAAGIALESQYPRRHARMTGL